VLGAAVLGLAALVIAASSARGELTSALLASFAGLALVVVGCYVGFESMSHSREAVRVRPRLDAYESFAAARQAAWVAVVLVVLGVVLLLAPLFASGANVPSTSSPSASPSDGD
jgi:hypothetical protein